MRLSRLWAVGSEYSGRMATSMRANIAVPRMPHVRIQRKDSILDAPHNRLVFSKLKQTVESTTQAG
jgi:hypothetical protein